MSEMTLETASVSTNGGSDALGLDSRVTVLAKDDCVSGRLELKGPGQVLGRFNGQIECDGDLYVGPEADVEADIHAERVTVAGTVRGNVTVNTRLKITTTGRLEGDAVVGALVVQEGGIHRGVIRVHPEGIPVHIEERQTAAATVKPVVVPLNGVGSPVGRVRKFWGEFF